ncbi:hypothetical protein DH2020_000173 [Rehmannia glutinosa]|uniref:Protein kinase domain-containing protein n=1 Tax=Rehmannia glutinosa TaxID=99300 RepID=A0ABR0XVV7_REHGL
MGCFGCFGFSHEGEAKEGDGPSRGWSISASREFLLDDDVEDEEDGSYNGDRLTLGMGRNMISKPKKKIRGDTHAPFAEWNDMQEFPLRKPIVWYALRMKMETRPLMNMSVKHKIGAGSYGKVVLYRSRADGKHYAIKSFINGIWLRSSLRRRVIKISFCFTLGQSTSSLAVLRSMFWLDDNRIHMDPNVLVAFHKSHLLKLRVAPSETAMTDVLREVLIMKVVSHPNIVNLVEVIDDPNTDHFYMVLEYVEGKWVCEGAGPPGGLEKILHGIFIAFELILLTFPSLMLWDNTPSRMLCPCMNIVHGDIKPDNLLVTASGTVKIGDFSVSQVSEDDNDELRRSPGTPVFTAPECCLDPRQRMTLENVAEHAWVVGEDGPIPKFLCWCKRDRLLQEEVSNGSGTPDESLNDIST